MADCGPATCGTRRKECGRWNGPPRWSVAANIADVRGSKLARQKLPSIHASAKAAMLPNAHRQLLADQNGKAVVERQFIGRQLATLLCLSAPCFHSPKPDILRSWVNDGKGRLRTGRFQHAKSHSRHILNPERAGLSSLPSTGAPRWLNLTNTSRHSCYYRKAIWRRLLTLAATGRH